MSTEPLLPSSKRLVLQSWNTSNGMFQTKHKAETELNFFEYLYSKRYLAEPDIIKYNRNKKPQYDLILGVKTMKKYGIILDFNSLSAKSVLVGEKLVAMYSISM
jgi:hypothetical protein